MNEELAIAADFLEDGDDFEIYTDRKGRKLKLGPIPFDEIHLEHRYLLEDSMKSKGLDPEDPEAVNKFDAGLSELEFRKHQKAILDDIRNNVCKSVINVNFVNKKQKDCVGDEVSIYIYKTAEVGDMQQLIGKMNTSDINIEENETENNENEVNSEG